MGFLRKPLIEFGVHEVFKDVLPAVTPAVKAIPEAYKRMPRNVPQPDWGGAKRSTVRACAPFFDAMTAGFVIPFPIDVRIVASPDGVHYYYDRYKYAIDGSLDSSPLWVSHHVPSQTEPLISDPILKIMSPYWVKTKPGWGALFTPLLNVDSQMTPLSGLVNTSKYLSLVNIVCRWRGGYGEFEFTQGQPLAQIIPVPLTGTTYAYTYLNDDEVNRRNVTGHYCAVTQNAYKKRYREKVTWTR